MTEKYKEAVHYRPEKTLACEVALALLLQAFGTLKSTLRLIGGLVPRYLAPASPPDVPEHVGTTDVDVVLDVAVLAEGEDYSTLRDQLRDAGFTRFMKPDGTPSSWQWEREVLAHRVVVEFLVHTDDPNGKGLVRLAGEDISACRIPHAGMASAWFLERELRVDHPDGDGVSTEVVRHADAAAFIALKALALKGRQTRKDVADLVHVLRYYEGSPMTLAQEFAGKLATGVHREALHTALAELHTKFCDDEVTEGYRKDGPGRFVAFHGIVDEDERVREQRDVSGLVTEFLRLVQEMSAWAAPVNAGS